METTTIDLRNRRVVLAVLFVILVCCVLFWYVAKNVSVYNHALVGALYEMAWLPAIFCTFAIPVYSLFRWYKDGWKLKSLFLLIVVLSLALIVWVIFPTSVGCAS